MQATKRSATAHRAGAVDRGSAAVLALALAIGAGLASSLVGAPPDKAAPAAKTETTGATEPTAPLEVREAAEATPTRLREGSRIEDETGFFLITGERVTFLGAGAPLRMVALENLNLERIVRVVADSPEKQEWIVRGTVTEYQGVNYLFIERAVLKSLVEVNEIR